MFREEITITYYKKRFYNTTLNPGEHHFCSIYLLNKFNRLPDYINPDGTKKVPGDIVFYRRSGPSIDVSTIYSPGYNDSIKNNDRFAIEVKYGEIFFTKTQFNMWFVDKIDKPDFLIALTDNYLFIIEWDIFQKIYIEKKYPGSLMHIDDYSKKISEEDLINSSEMKIDLHYFDLNQKSVKKLENKIDNRFVSLNNQIEERVRSHSIYHSGPASYRMHTTAKLYKIPKELITKDLYQKYKNKIDTSDLYKKADDLFIDLKGELYIKTDIASYYQLQIKIPELVKD